MSDLMASAFATFLDHRRTKHHHHHNPSPPFTSSPSTYDFLHPPLHPPPLPKRQRSSLTFNDLLHDNPPPIVTPVSPLQQPQPANLLSGKQIPRNSYISNRKQQHLNSISTSDKSPSATYETNGPAVGVVPHLAGSHLSSKQPVHQLLYEQAPPIVSSQVPHTSRSTDLSTSSLSVHPFSLLNETPPQKPKSNTPRPFVCSHDGCSASFIKQNHLSRHIRIVHNKERPYHCTEPGCGSRFGSKSHLGDHTRAVHMRIKLFKCEMCNASWSKRFNLKKHIRVRHLGEKPFRCHQCQLSFGTRSHATRHELRVHKQSFAKRLADPKGNVCT